MFDKGGRLAGEFGRFATTGTVASLVAIGLFNWLAHWDLGIGAGGALLHDHAITAFLIANGASVLLTYYLSRWWAFRHRRVVGAFGGMLTFYAISVGSLIIPVSCLWFSRNVLELTSATADNIAANVVGLFLGFVARFALFSTFVFLHHPDADTSPDEQPAVRGQLEHQPEA
jgi:putative flippase GtrA